MKAEHNQRITQIGAGTPCGALMRRYWQPVALLDEFDPRLDPRMAERPLKAVRLLGQDFILFRDATGQYGLLDRDCPHRGADLAYARHEGDGVRCPFHGWKFDAQGRCLETPAEPSGSNLCQRVRQRSYPLQIRSGLIFAWLGPKTKRPRPCPPSIVSKPLPATPSLSKANGLATGCRRLRWALTPRTPRSCTASSKTRASMPRMADSFAARAPATWRVSAGP